MKTSRITTNFNDNFSIQFKAQKNKPSEQKEKQLREQNMSAAQNVRTKYLLEKKGNA